MTRSKVETCQSGLLPPYEARRRSEATSTHCATHGRSPSVRYVALPSLTPEPSPISHPPPTSHIPYTPTSSQLCVRRARRRLAHAAQLTPLPLHLSPSLSLSRCVQDHQLRAVRAAKGRVVLWLSPSMRCCVISWSAPPAKPLTTCYVFPLRSLIPVTCS